MEFFIQITLQIVEHKLFDWLPVSWKILKYSFCVMESLHCNFHDVEDLNCTYHIVDNITRCSFPYSRNYQCFFTKLLLFLIVKIHIVNHLEYFFHISLIEPTDMQGHPQILPQSAKFLPRACSRRSCNIPSLVRWVGRVGIDPIFHYSFCCWKKTWG